MHAPNPTQRPPTPAPVPTRRVDVVDDYHGTLVADPYRWLEDASDAEVLAWTEAQTARTRGWLDAIPAREAFRQRLTTLWDYPRWGIPIRLPQSSGPREFELRNDGLQNQSVLYVRDSPQSEPRVLLDPNTLSEDGTIALSGWQPSRNGVWLTWASSSGGSDWQELRVRNVERAEDLPDLLQWCKFSSIAWLPDSSGFFYTRYPEPRSADDAAAMANHQVMLHRVGTPQGADVLIHERPDAPELRFEADVTHDGAWLVLTAGVGTDPRTRIFVCALAADGSVGPAQPLLDAYDAAYSVIDHVGDGRFLVRTDNAAPLGRVISVALSDPSPAAWQDVIPEADDQLQYVLAAGDALVALRVRDASHRLLLHARDGTLQREVPLPEIGSIDAVYGEPGEPSLALSFTSFLHPSTPCRLDLSDANAHLEALHANEIPFETEGFETRQVFVTSKDGTRVPMFLTHRRGLEPTGEHPTLLYGYGGFNTSLTPSFAIHRLAWLEAGGVFALANLRGGEEYGEAWHQAGMLERKQNVFDDFIACAEWLTDPANGISSRARLAINGGSNGGLLVAACMTQRPDLYGAVVCEVPVIDMLRYHRFTVGHFWTGEFGNAEENAEHFRFLYAYSPLHNVRPGTAYPPTLITSADSDDRVVPAHAKKFMATLQTAQTGDNPILLRVELRAGHGQGKPTSKIIDERADVYAFLSVTLGGLTPPSNAG